MRDFWGWDSCWELFVCYCIYGGFGGWEAILVAGVMFEGWTDVVTVKSMCGEGAELFGCFMKDYFGAGECQRSYVEIEFCDDAGICRDIWLTSGRA